MKSLIVEDDFAARRLMQIYLAAYGECSIAINGVEAVNAVKLAIQEDAPYDLICLDIMMPIMDGTEALAKIRQFEKENGIGDNEMAKVIITTAKNLSTETTSAFKKGYEAYLIKPIRKKNLVDQIKKMGILKSKYHV